MSNSFEKNKAVRLLIAGGGTGGHVFPGIAIAEAMERLTPLEVLWIGTGRPVEKTAISKTPWKYEILDVKPLAVKSPLSIIKSLFHIPLDILRAIRLLKAFRPHVVLGVGGYVSGPVILAARLLGIPSTIHEQNLVPGLSNRLASKFATLIFVSFEGTKTLFPGRRVIHTGNPVRDSVLSFLRKDHEEDEAFHVLVVGGSQGASVLNRIVSSALNILSGRGFKIKVMHQTGPSDKEIVEVSYRKEGVDARVFSFISEMGEAYAWSDVVICRAGAGTITELTALGKPSILIPYPFSAGGHQDAHATDMKKAGASIFFKEAYLRPGTLAMELEDFIKNPEKLKKMGEKASILGRPDAAKEIAGLMLKAIHKGIKISQRDFIKMKKEGSHCHV